MKQVKRTDAATSESSQIPLNSTSSECSEAQPDHIMRRRERRYSRSPASGVTKRDEVGDPKMRKVPHRLRGG